ncbi:ferrous iron transport protein B [Sulfurimonas diazotrophicus]|uniref:Ferrous iron transport protein B n=1 Tax=Sulfurimonas diazotrophicus TaxID=3131939 RepID=A0ABZ3HAN6_9BACT
MPNTVPVCPVTEKHIRIALVGQPNVGKSMLINAISDARLHVGNFSGVTVEKSEVFFDYKDYHFTIVDLPGTYAFTDYSIEERVTHDFLCNEEYDLMINVVDSTNLEKNLQLTAELMTMNKKMVLALNMSDEADREGIRIDYDYLSTLLGLTAVRVSAAAKMGIETLIEAVIATHETSYQEPKLIFSQAVEEEIDIIASYLDEHRFKAAISNRNIAINLLQNEKKTYRTLHDLPLWTELQPLLIEADKHIETHHDTDDVKEVFAEEYAAFIRGVITETVRQTEQPIEKKSLTERVDDLLIHPVLGIPIFLFLMWGLFQLTFEIGNIPMEWIDAFFGWFGETVGATIPNADIRSLVVDGVIAGVGAVVLFTPNIIILFIGIALLESTGYMSRVAFLLDGVFHKFGLHGQSFIPLVTGFGCSIPAYMSARILKNDSDRLLTLFIIGFMSCGARLPVYVLFTGAFFAPSIAGNVLFAIYIAGAMIGLVAAKVLKLTAFRGQDEPFVMEMPKYRLPSVKLIWHTVLTKTLMYLRKAGTFIAGASMLVWFLSSYPHSHEIEAAYSAKIEQAVNTTEASHLTVEADAAQLEQSYLGRIGKAIEPFFTPIGLDWKMAIALQTGLAAKEVVVSTLGVLYAVGEGVTETDKTLISAIRAHIPFASAVAFIVVIMLYLPCLAASVVFTREAGGIKYFIYLFLFTTATAYTLAFVAYHLTLMLTGAEALLPH